MAPANCTDVILRHSASRLKPWPNRNKASFSDQAEDFVTTLAILRGWRIHARNFRRPGCEIDIIMERNGILAAVEVKLRQGDFMQDALLAPRKREALVRGMEFFLALGWSSASVIRFDLAVVGFRNGRPALRCYVADVFQA